MKTHVWLGVLPRCKYCDCTSLEAQRLQPDTKGVGPCPLPHDKELAHRLLAEWVSRQQQSKVT